MTSLRDPANKFIWIARYRFITELFQVPTEKTATVDSTTRLIIKANADDKVST